MKNFSDQTTVSRRRLLQTAGTGAVVIGLGLGAIPGTAAAMNKAELIEAMASHAGISAPDAQGVLDTFINATTKALKEGDSAVLVGFGSFSISKRSARTGRNPSSGNGHADDSPVTFESCPEFAAALDLNPGRGDEASAKCRDADVVIDAEYIASQMGRDSDKGLSKADAKRALEGFTDATTKALKKGDRLSLGERFGTFSISTSRKALKKGDRLSVSKGVGASSISKRSARTGRNPQTGKEIQIAAKNVVEFKAGAELSKAVN